MPSFPWPRLFLASLGVLAVVLGVRHAYKVADERSAFRRWQPQIQALDEGADLSAKFNYPNPPIMAVLLEPLAWLPPVPAAMTPIIVPTIAAFRQLRPGIAFVYPIVALYRHASQVDQLLRMAIPTNAASPIPEPACKK